MWSSASLGWNTLCTELLLELNSGSGKAATSAAIQTDHGAGELSTWKFI